MLIPGSLSFTVIRGIQFDQYILQARDENVLVTTDQVGPPNATGTYVPCGQFSGYDLFILGADTSWFLYYNSAAATYVISQTLTPAALTNYFVPTLPLIEPTGSYAGQGSLTGKSATATDNPVDLTGFAAQAFVRRSINPAAEIVLDLKPQITDAVNGEITIPAISGTDTEALIVGNFYWDLVLIGLLIDQRLGPFAKGSFLITDNITSSLV